MGLVFSSSSLYSSVIAFDLLVPLGSYRGLSSGVLDFVRHGAAVCGSKHCFWLHSLRLENNRAAFAADLVHDVLYEMLRHYMVYFVSEIFDFPGVLVWKEFEPASGFDPFYFRLSFLCLSFLCLSFLCFCLFFLCNYVNDQIFLFLFVFVVVHRHTQEASLEAYEEVVCLARIESFRFSFHLVEILRLVEIFRLLLGQVEVPSLDGPIESCH